MQTIDQETTSQEVKRTRCWLRLGSGSNCWVVMDSLPSLVLVSSICTMNASDDPRRNVILETIHAAAVRRLALLETAILEEYLV